MEKMDLVINNLFLKKEYEKIVLFYEKNLMMNNDVFLSELKEISIYAIVFSLIVNEKTEEIEFLIYKLKKENLFSKDNFFSYLFLILFSFLKNLNIFKALSLIGEIEVLNEDRFIELLGEEEFSYTNVLKCDDINAIPCLLLIVMISNLDIEKIKSFDDIMINYYEMVDLVYENSCDSEVIEYLINVSKIFI